MKTPSTAWTYCSRRTPARSGREKPPKRSRLCNHHDREGVQRVICRMRYRTAWAEPAELKPISQPEPSYRWPVRPSVTKRALNVTLSAPNVTLSEVEGSRGFGSRRCSKTRVDSSATLRITMALRRPRKTMKMRPPFHRRSGAGRSPGAGARFPTQGRTEGIGPLQFVFIAMTVNYA